MAGLELEATAVVQQRGPLSDETERKRPRSILRSGTVLRPLRTPAVGVPLKVTPADKAFLNRFRAINAPLKFHSPCPKAPFPPSRTHYMKYMHAAAYFEALELGATQADIEWDYLCVWLPFPAHEPGLLGHVLPCLLILNN